jgi:hypothetical protein
MPVSRMSQVLVSLVLVSQVLVSLVIALVPTLGFSCRCA